MFEQLSLKATYSTYEDDVGEEFYSPVLEKSVFYDRASAYFSAKALASYAKGLEAFAKQGNHCRLLISSQVSEDDFQAILKGYEGRHKVSMDMLPSLREDLNLEEESCLSNLAYLITLGIIDIKIAFTKAGIFHDKFGIAGDLAGNLICFRGSNNETEAAFDANYEAFDITCSWLASAFDYSKITKSRETFEKLWDGQVEGIVTCDPDQVLLDEIETHNKGKIIIDPVLLEKDCAILDYDERLHLLIKMDTDMMWKGPFYKLRLHRYVDEVASLSTDMIFRPGYKYPTFKKLIGMFKADSAKRGYRFFTTKRLERYIQSREMYINERAETGLAIKRQADEVLDRYEKYKAIVDAAMERKLRDKQMWDSFFMCTMRKSSNFSVPGSGKTASVLGAFAYLSEVCGLKRIVMVGPKNSFDSWIDEFKNCFGKKRELKYFSIQDEKLKTLAAKKTAISFETGNCNLLLFNYEGLGSYIDELKKLIDDDTLLVFDEVHKVKARDGLRAAYALELAEDACYTVALTGTPIPNSYLDIRNLLEMLYGDDYDEFFGFSDQQLRAPSLADVEEINSKLQPFFCRTTKQQLGVPAAEDDTIICTEAQDAENRLFQILAMKYSKNFLVLIIRLLQLESDPHMLLETLDMSEFADILDTSGSVDDIDYADFSSEVHELIESIDRTCKFDACVETAKGLFAQNKPMIIWCIFVSSIYRLQAELEKNGMRVGVIYGGTSQDERTLLLDAFRAGKLDVLITNPHTLAESVSLHSICHDAIYFEYSYNLVHLLQSKDRIHRLGLKPDQYTQYYFMREDFTTTDGELYSLDGAIYDRLMEKERIMLDAIDKDVLENGSTSEEDLDIIFKGLKL